MIFDFDNDGKNDFTWSRPSGWYIYTTGDSWALGLGVDLRAWGIASVSANIGGGEGWIQIKNKNHPNAGALSMPDGTALPDWPRHYWLVMQTAGPGIGGSLGASAAGRFSANLDQSTIDNASGAIGGGEYNFIHRWDRAPEGEAQEQGDPTGFLGAALQDGISGSMAIGLGVSGAACTMALGAMVDGLRGLLLATATDLGRIFLNLTGIEHLGFQYGAALWSTADTTTLGLGVSVSASMQIAYVPRMHLFIVHPDLGVPFYCYTRGVRADGTVTKYTDRDMKTTHTYYDPAVIDDYTAAVQTAQYVDRLDADWQRITSDPGFPFNDNDGALANQNNRLAAYRVLRGRLDEHPSHPMFARLHEKYDYGWGRTEGTLNQSIRYLEEARSR